MSQLSSSPKSVHNDHFQAYLHSCKASLLPPVWRGKMSSSHLPVLGELDEFLSNASPLVVFALFQLISHTDRLACASDEGVSECGRTAVEL